MLPNITAFTLRFHVMPLSSKEHVRALTSGNDLPTHNEAEFSNTHTQLNDFVNGNKTNEYNTTSFLHLDASVSSSHASAANPTPALDAAHSPDPTSDRASRGHADSGAYLFFSSHPVVGSNATTLLADMFSLYDDFVFVSEGKHGSLVAPLELAAERGTGYAFMICITGRSGSSSLRYLLRITPVVEGMDHATTHEQPERNAVLAAEGRQTAVSGLDVVGKHVNDTVTEKSTRRSILRWRRNAA